jgi:hypothetical protein
MLSLNILLVGCSSNGIATPSNSSVPAAVTTQATTPPVPATTTTTSATPTPTVIPTTQTATSSPTPTQPAPQNIIIDHTNWDWYNSQGNTVISAVAQQKIFFAHASVGANIISGLKALKAADASKYPLALISSAGTPPASTAKGTIYEFSRGNPAWNEKITSFENYLKNGWHNSVIDIVMNKFCYIDQHAEWKTYTSSMEALEAKYPGTVFVYWTMPYTTAANSDGVLRSQFNQNLRQWIASKTGKVLFDLADIEAWTADGKPQTFTSKGTVHQNLVPAYTSDGGHLNADASKRAANGLYSLLGKITSVNSLNK